MQTTGCMRYAEPVLTILYTEHRNFKNFTYAVLNIYCAIRISTCFCLWCCLTNSYQRTGDEQVLNNEKFQGNTIKQHEYRQFCLHTELWHCLNYAIVVEGLAAIINTLINCIIYLAIENVQLMEEQATNRKTVDCITSLFLLIQKKKQKIFSVVDRRKWALQKHFFSHQKHFFSQQKYKEKNRQHLQTPQSSEKKIHKLHCLKWPFLFEDRKR